MDYKQEIRRTLTPVLEDMITELLTNKPVDPLKGMIDFLQARIGLEPVNEKDELRILRQEVARLKSFKNIGSEGEISDEEEEDDFIEDNLTLPRSSQRNAVSAEAYGTWNKKENFQPRFLSKTPEHKARIQSILNNSFMFAELDSCDKDIVIDALELRTIQAGQYITKEGEDGNELFVVDSGTLKCYKKIQGQDKHVKSYGAGDSFGELALLYNCPRAASIITDSYCELWVLDRACFNHIVKDSAIKSRERYESFLSKVEVLENMDPYEKTQIADALKTARYKEGEYVIRENEPGDLFYIIEEGTAVATKTIKIGSSPEEVNRYHPGDYFGELALLKEEPRAANIIATSGLKCVYLDRHSFKRVLGPLEGILKRNAQKYETILSNLRNK